MTTPAPWTPGASPGKSRPWPMRGKLHTPAPGIPEYMTGRGSPEARYAPHASGSCRSARGCILA